MSREVGARGSSCPVSATSSCRRSMPAVAHLRSRSSPPATARSASSAPFAIASVRSTHLRSMSPISRQRRNSARSSAPLRERRGRAGRRPAEPAAEADSAVTGGTRTRTKRRERAQVQAPRSSARRQTPRRSSRHRERMGHRQVVGPRSQRTGGAQTTRRQALDWSPFAAVARVGASLHGRLAALPIPGSIAERAVRAQLGAATGWWR